MNLKYLFKNIKSLFKDSFFVIIMAMAGTILSSLLICFSYAIYQNYNMIIEIDESQEDAEECYNFSIDNGDELQGDLVTKQVILDTLIEYESSKEKKQEPGLYYLYGTIDGNDYLFGFTIDGNSGKVTSSENFKRTMDTHITNGSYWSEEDEEEGNPVALCFDDSFFNKGMTPILDEIRNGDTLTIGGKEYSIVGYQTWTDDGAMIPIESAPDDMLISKVMVYYDEPVTTREYNLMKQIGIAHMGTRVTFQEIATMDKDTYYTYRTVLIICICIAIVAALNIMILFKYIMSRRNKKSAIYRICGLSRSKICFMNYVECMVMTMPFFLIGILMFNYMLLPYLMNYFAYVEGACTLPVYGALFGSYFVISGLVLTIMIVVINHKSILNLLRFRG